MIVKSYLIIIYTIIILLSFYCRLANSLEGCDFSSEVGSTSSALSVPWVLHSPDTGPWKVDQTNGYYHPVLNVASWEIPVNEGFNGTITYK